MGGPGLAPAPERNCDWATTSWPSLPGAGAARLGATRRGRHPKRVPTPASRQEEAIAELIVCAAVVIVLAGSAPPMIAAYAWPSGVQTWSIAGIAGIG